MHSLHTIVHVDTASRPLPRLHSALHLDSAVLAVPLRRPAHHGVQAANRPEDGANKGHRARQACGAGRVIKRAAQGKTLFLLLISQGKLLFLLLISQGNTLILWSSGTAVTHPRHQRCTRCTPGSRTCRAQSPCRRSHRPRLCAAAARGRGSSMPFVGAFRERPDQFHRGGANDLP